MITVTSRRARLANDNKIHFNDIIFSLPFSFSLLIFSLTRHLYIKSRDRDYFSYRTLTWFYRHCFVVLYCSVLIFYLFCFHRERTKRISQCLGKWWFFQIKIMEILDLCSKIVRHNNCRIFIVSNCRYGRFSTYRDVNCRCQLEVVHHKVDIMNIADFRKITRVHKYTLRNGYKCAFLLLDPLLFRNNITYIHDIIGTYACACLCYEIFFRLYYASR